MTTQDCQTWGSNAQEAFMLRIKSSSVYETSLIAGQNQSCLSDTSWQQTVQLSTSFAFSHAKANTVYSLHNGTLLAVANISQVEPSLVSPFDLFSIINRFFEVPVSDSGVTEVNLIDYVAIYLNQSLSSPSPYTVLAAQTFFQSLLTIPLLWFQANSQELANSNGIQAALNVPCPDLPSDLYVLANLAKSERRIVIASWTVIVFMILGLGVYAWSIILLSWGMRIHGPDISSFPLVDFASRVACAGMANGSPADALSRTATRSDLRAHLQGLRLFLRELDFDQGDEFERQAEGGSGGLTQASNKTIGFSTRAEGYARLKHGIIADRN